MPLVFQRIKTDGIAQISYLIGDDEAQTAAVIDPQPDAQVYIDLARRFGVGITHIFETHIHADFMSGARSLAQRLGRAELCASVEGGAKYGFDVRGVRDGDAFEFGAVRLTALHTPGHTPEHMAYLVASKDRPRDPWAVFTGDSLFVGSAGRPDLMGGQQTDQLAGQLFHTLRDIYLDMDDGIVILPCHGAGSACGADIGDRPMSTIGYERRSNEFLQYHDADEFKRFVRQSAPPEPHHYRRLKKLNSTGPPIIERPPAIPALPPEQFKEAVEHGVAQLVDTRQMLAFGGGHIDGALNIGSRPELSVWAGQMLDTARPILLVVEHEDDLDAILWRFVHTGFTRFADSLAGGMKAWENAGYPLRALPQVRVHELHERLEETQVLDARAPDEWEQGHIPGAVHHYAADLRDDGELAELARDEPLTVYCDSGYRASIAASLLQARGFADVRNVPGSWQAWRNAGYEVVK